MGTSLDDLHHTTLTVSHFVPNITMGAPILEHVHKNLPDLYMDCHMMVSNPAQVGLSEFQCRASTSDYLVGARDRQGRWIKLYVPL
jgi:pentose-5-phosphate-3-epimerase